MAGNLILPMLSSVKKIILFCIFMTFFCLTWNILLTSSFSLSLSLSLSHTQKKTHSLFLSFSLPFFLYQLLSLLPCISLCLPHSYFLLSHLVIFFLLVSLYFFLILQDIQVNHSHISLSLSLLLSPSQFHTLTIFFISLQLPLYVLFVKSCLSFFSLIFSLSLSLVSSGAPACCIAKVV